MQRIPVQLWRHNRRNLSNCDLSARAAIVDYELLCPPLAMGGGAKPWSSSSKQTQNRARPVMPAESYVASRQRCDLLQPMDGSLSLKARCIRQCVVLSLDALQQSSRREGNALGADAAQKRAASASMSPNMLSVPR